MAKGKGRKKVEMVKMSNESHLQASFSTRRSGLFKKASELCILCHAEVAIVVFSPGKKVYSFGDPCVESVIGRFVDRNPISGSTQPSESHNNARIGKLNIQLTQVLNQLEIEKKRGIDLANMRKASQRQCWWQAPIEDLNQPQLEQLRASLKELRKNVVKEAQKLLIQPSTSQVFSESSSTEW